MFKNPFVVFTLVIIVLTCFFYSYPADIFQAELTEKNGISFNKDLTLKQILRPDLILPTSPAGYETISLTLKGWFMLFVILIALPIMIAYRVTLKRYPRRAQKN